jgi:sugar O-acyltransferase (sialic acid O-acetyltransferase NeuD family)
MEPIVLIGGGGHCISCIDVILAENKYEIIGILDTPEKMGTSISGFQIIGTDSEIPDLIKKFRNFFITIGQIKTAEKRIKLYNAVKDNGGSLPVIISPLAYVSQSAKVGEGTIIMHRALLNAETVIGKNCIINTGALIEHEAIVGDFSHISTQAVINGQAKIGNQSFIGSNSTISNNVSLPEKIIVAAGANILKSIQLTGVYIGNPAKKAI